MTHEDTHIPGNEFVTRVKKDGEVVLGNLPLRTMGPVGFDLVNLYGRKTQSGDPQPNDHPTDSTISQQDHIGGIGTLIYEGDEDRGNSWFSTAWMQTSKTLTNGPYTFEYEVAGEEESFAYVHDKIDDQVIATFGDVLMKWNEVTDVFDNPSVTLGATPSGGGITWGDANTAKKLYIPCGSTYYTFDGTSAAAGLALEGAISFAIWSEKLFKLDNNGDIKFTADGGATWTLKGTIPREVTPKKLFIWVDNDGNSTLHIATSGAVYVLDFTNALVFETAMDFPDHPYQGNGATMWRGDAYVSVGVGVHRDAKGLITAVGLDGRDGLPPEYANGYFVALEPSYNELLGTVVGGLVDESTIEETSDMVAGIPDTMYSQARDRFSVVVGYNGFGWHPRWIGEVEVTNIRVHSQSGVYRAFWGAKGKVYSQILPRAYYNPSYQQAVIPVAKYNRHETPYYNWGMIDTPKILKYFETHTSNCDENNYIKIWCRIDDETEWGDGQNAGSPLAIIATNGQHRLLTGYHQWGDRLLHAGLTHERVQFAFEFFANPDADYESPVMDWYTIVGRKWMRTVRVFTFQVDASTPYDGNSTYTISQHIYNCAREQHGVPLVIADQLFMVDVTADSGNIAAGMDWQAYHNLSCIEMIEEDNE